MTTAAPAGAPVTITYHDRLRRARIAAHLEQRTLARLIGCSPSTVSAVETGKQELGATRLFRWAHVCGVSLDWVAQEQDA